MELLHTPVQVRPEPFEARVAQRRGVGRRHVEHDARFAGYD